MPVSVALVVVIPVACLDHRLVADGANSDFRWCRCFWFEDIVVHLRDGPLTVFVLFRSPSSTGRLLIRQVLLGREYVMVDSEIWNDQLFFLLGLLTEIGLLPRS